MFESTGTRVSMYLSAVVLVVGNLGLYMAHHKQEVGVAGVVFAASMTAATLALLATLVRTKSQPVKIAGEPLALGFITTAGVGFWQGSILKGVNPIFDLIVSGIILAIFVASMVEHEKEARNKAEIDAKLAQREAANQAAAEFAKANETPDHLIG